MIESKEKPPYEMTREEWKSEKEKCKILHGQMNLTKGSASQEISRMSRLEFLLFGIGEWIYNKACAGEEWALDALEYGCYDRYDMVINKAKEEGLICSDNQ